MTIKKIEIKNIKGIKDKSFELDILANRPSLLVAPNGFGKSSFAAAFLSLLQNRLSVHEDHHHKADADLPSELGIEYEDENGQIHSLTADGARNEIHKHFSWFVINNQIKAKGIGRNFGGRNVVSASIAVDPVVLIETIPARECFGYSYAQRKQDFGRNGKVLPNITQFPSSPNFVKGVGDQLHELDRIGQVRNSKAIADVVAEIDEQNGTADQLLAWIKTNKLGELEAIDPLREVAEIVLSSNLGITERHIAFLAAIQISRLYDADKSRFKRAQKYANYIIEKKQYSQILAAFNTSWCAIVPKEKGRKLVVEFPKAKHISNGQRDVITFVALLYRAQNRLRGRNGILIIDEVFDYLDDANLVAVQYYITKMIERYKGEGRRLYPLILTHLNPHYFKNFIFSKQKVYYLDRRDINAKPAMIKLLRNRGRPSIEQDVSKYLLHYHPDDINKRQEFEELGLKATWGEGQNFNTFIEEECRKYADGEAEFDPLAVCCAVRNLVEKNAYQQLPLQADRDTFIDTHKTRNKLEFAESVGASVPEYFYLLGVIYNEGMHWREGQDNLSPIAVKLENSTVRSLICKVRQV
ncbi:hypothetical protein ASALC70_03490 [Alcanivorax sp. ALC70]|nr:hypothetical protein ASALC70_03490 [Alcanivorax sp. ALC70]